MADHPPPNDFNNNTNPSSINERPPPLPADLENPTPAEDQALENWLQNNKSYITGIRWHRLPSLPALSPLWGYYDHDFRAECLESLLFYTCLAGRRLHDTERDAILEPIARTAVAASYDRPVVMGLGLWLMARSWRKSGIAAAQQQHLRTVTSGGVVGADGTISHFSGPAAAAGRSDIVKTLVRRVGRTSLVGLSCLAVYSAVWTPWRYLLSQHEVESIRVDLRLHQLLHDLDEGMKHKAAGVFGRRGW